MTPAAITANTIKAVNELREEIAPLKEELDELELWSRSRAETLECVSDRLHAERDKAIDLLRDKLAEVARGRSLRLISLNRDGGYRVDGDEANDCFAAMLVGAAGPKLIEAICAEAVADLPLHADKKSRADRLATVQAELDRLERAEEKLISDAELEDVFIPRRRDVRIEIVLEVVKP